MKMLRALLLILLMLLSVTIFFFFLTTAGGSTEVGVEGEMQFSLHDSGLLEFH